MELAHIWPAVVVAALIAFCAIAAWLAREASRLGDASGAPRPAWRIDAIYIGAACLFIALARLPILLLSREIQPDEAQYGANALLAASGWLNWDTLDSGSSGPMQAMAQAWPLLFGADVTFTTIHITGAVLACAIAAFTYLAIRHGLGAAYGVVFATPLTLFLGGVTYWELVHSSSLYLPISLSLFGLFAAVWTYKRPNWALAIAAAAALGVIPLVKPHGAMLGIYAGLVLVWAHARAERAWRGKALRAAALALAAAAPLAVSLGSLAIRGRLGDFFLETLSYSSAYVGRSAGRVGEFYGPIYWIEAALGVPHLAVLVVIYGLAIAVFGALWLPRWRDTSFTTWSFIGFFIVACISVMTPGRELHLYLLFVVGSLALPAAALAKEALEARPRWRVGRDGWTAAAAAGATGLVMLPTAAWGAANSPAFVAEGAYIANGLRFTSPRLLSFLAPDPDARLIVFGYFPALYVNAGMQSGTRETWSENEIEDRPNRDIYRRRFLAEMDASRPVVFADVIAGGTWGWQDNERFGPAGFPGLAQRLDADYAIVSRTGDDPDCSRIHLRRDAAERLSARLAAVSSVTASGALVQDDHAYEPAHVVDRHVFETCVDRWLAPAASAAWLDLALESAQDVSGVSLLNTRGAWRSLPEERIWHYPFFFDNVAEYRAARTAVVKLMRGDDVVAEREVRVDGYPYWTDVAFDPDSARGITHVRIELPDWRGAGPGLNEVAIRLGAAGGADPAS